MHHDNADDDPGYVIVFGWPLPAAQLSFFALFTYFPLVEQKPSKSETHSLEVERGAYYCGFCEYVKCLT